MDIATGANVTLALLTAVYVFYTGRLNHHTRNSANAAERAASDSQRATTAALETAQASQRAAEAAERSAALSEATIGVEFTAKVHTAGARTVVMLRSESASIYVFSVRVSMLVVPRTDGGVREVHSTTTVTNDDGQPVVFVHRGEETMAVLPDPIPAGDTVFGHAVVAYGFQVEPAGRERTVTIPHQEVEGFGSHSTEGHTAAGE